ncbi:MAG: glycosyltransferase family 2 protein [Candidatus Korobacteraceae bacterium]|jgi:GT2 family glycosyltransferase
MLHEVIVVSFNSAQDIRACVSSIISSGGVPVVVDNGSTDETLQILADDFPQVRVLRNRRNSYSCAANIGLANTAGDVVILSNADVIYPPNSISRLCTYVNSHGRIGVLGPQQVFPDGSWQRSWGMVPGIMEALCEFFCITTLYNATRRGLWPVRVNRRTLNVGYVDGAVMTIRRRAFDSIRGFDERFPFSSEDTDFCLRARRAGWQVVALPTFDVVHRRGGSSRCQGWSADRHAAVLLEGTRIFLDKYHGTPFTGLYFNIKRLSSWMLMVLCEAGSRVAPQARRGRLREKARIHRSYCDQLRTTDTNLPVDSPL